MDDVLIDASLVKDPDAANELGPGPQAIADEDLAGSRFLLVRRAVEPIQYDGGRGGAVALGCVFQPAPDARFAWARIALKLTIPPGVRLLDVGPREVREQEPVRFTVDAKGKLGVSQGPFTGAVEDGLRREFVVYHCQVQGSGDGTALALWSFKENPHRQDGLGPEQVLTLSVAATGRVTGQVTVSARLVRGGLSRALDTLRDLVLAPAEQRYPIGFDVPREGRRSYFG